MLVKHARRNKLIQVVAPLSNNRGLQLQLELAATQRELKIAREQLEEQNKDLRIARSAVRALASALRASLDESEELRPN